jgi:hypothetical protein
MNVKTKNIINCLLAGGALYILMLLALILPKPELLHSERRPPAKLPELSLEAIMKDGAAYGESFMKRFDDGYAPDNFPFREAFRSLKAALNTHVFMRLDKDGVYVAQGFAAEMQKRIDDASIAHATEKLTNIYENYLRDRGITPYISIIPDKGYFLSEPNGYPTMDYAAFIEKLLSGVEFADYIDITDTLSIEDYYFSDTHWRQERLKDVASALLVGMGGELNAELEEHELDADFYGVYSGRAPVRLGPERIRYLTSPALDGIRVIDHEHGGKEIGLYNFEKARGRDGYDFFLSGELSKVTVENPHAKGDRELILFRDSFGRSIVPLLACEYSKITVIDIRYQIPAILLSGVSLENADVLFLYSTLVLNSSYEMK